MISKTQLRMALAALGMQSAELAEVTGMHKNTIFKANKGTASKQTYAVLELALRDKGVMFGVLEDGTEWTGIKPKEDA